MAQNHPRHLPLRMPQSMALRPAAHHQRQTQKEIAMTEYQNEWYHKNKERLRDGRRLRNKHGYEERKDYIRKQKIAAGQCVLCQYKCTPDNHVAFDWDHLDPQTKKFALGGVRQESFHAIKEEIAKCRLICKNCHAIETYLKRHHKIRRDKNGDTYQQGDHPDQLSLEL